MSKMSESWIALVGTLFGGAGFKIIEWFMGRAKERDNRASHLRDEIDEARDEADGWRDRYYALVAHISTGDTQGALRIIEENKEK